MTTFEKLKIALLARQVCANSAEIGYWDSEKARERCEQLQRNFVEANNNVSLLLDRLQTELVANE